MATLYFNPACSKCRTAASMLDERHVEVETIRYLESPPSVEDLRRLMGLLKIDDPRKMMRTSEPVYAELRLADAPPHRLLEAITEHPVLLERPIFIHGGRAVIGRPPERLLELL